MLTLSALKGHLAHERRLNLERGHPPPRKLRYSLVVKQIIHPIDLCGGGMFE